MITAGQLYGALAIHLAISVMAMYWFNRAVVKKTNLVDEFYAESFAQHEIFLNEVKEALKK